MTDLFRPAFNSIPDDGLVKITQTKVMNLKLGPSDDTSHDVIYTTAIKYMITNFHIRKCDGLPVTLLRSL